MRCSKCQGLLIKETFYPPKTESALEKYEGLRCTGCGEVIDSVILQNRKPTPPIILSWTHNPDQITVLVNSKRYTYELPLYWIEKVERMWKYSAWKAFNMVKEKGVLKRSLRAHHRAQRRDDENLYL